MNTLNYSWKKRLVGEVTLNCVQDNIKDNKTLLKKIPFEVELLECFYLKIDFQSFRKTQKEFGGKLFVIKGNWQCSHGSWMF